MQSIDMGKTKSKALPFERRNTVIFLTLLGDTPLVPLNRINSNKKVRLLAKLKQTNPSGSIKDSPTLFMIEEGKKNGTLQKNKIVLEATSGNTGIGLSMVYTIKGYRLDDKTILGSAKVGLSLKAYIHRFPEAFLTDMDILSIKKTDQYPRTTEHITEMLNLCCA
jgi:hypothetical protein